MANTTRAAAAAVAITMACASGEPGVIPVVEGTYLGTWALAVEGDRVSCPAAVTIADQVDGAFRTTFEVRRRNGDGLGCIDTIQTGNGVVRADRTITMLAEAVEPVSCTLVGSNEGLSGTVRADSVAVSGRYTYRCPQEFTWTMAFAGTTGGAPLPPYPDLRGTYSGSWSILVQGLLLSCPATLTLGTQTRDDVLGAYTLAAAGSCVAQPAQALEGSVTVDGDVRLTGTPPISPGCTLARELVLSGTTADGTLNLTGGFALLCSGVVREFAVSLALERE